MKRSSVGVLVLIGVAASAGAGGAGIGIVWTKSEVVPVVLVKPGIFGFGPVEGSILGNTWEKSDVRPVVIVEPGIGGFHPRDGISIGNTWVKDDVLPVLLVEAGTGGFVPLALLSPQSDGLPASVPDQAGPPNSTPETQKITPERSSPTLIEGQVDGGFSGWEGETVIRLTNGQIWQQAEYYYHYHYAFMPRVLIYSSGGAYRMKVDGIAKSITVTRLK